MRRVTSVALALAGAIAAVLVGSCSDNPVEPAGSTAAPTAHMPIAFATASTGSGATFTTDKDDYVPGDTLKLAGTGWLPGDSLDILLTEDPANNPPLNWVIGVDDSGNFSDSTYIVQDSDAGVTFSLTATSRATGETATATFYDGGSVTATTINGTTISGAGGQAVTVASAASLSVVVTFTSTCSGGGCPATSATPRAWESTRFEVTGGTSTVNVCKNDVSFAASASGNTHSFSVTGPVDGNTYSVKVTAYESDNCVGAYGGGATYANKLIIPTLPTQLVLTTSPFSAGVGVCSPTITVQTRDASNNPADVVGSAVQVNFTSTSGGGTFYSNSGCTTGVTSVTIAAGSHVGSFYYKDTSCGTPTIKAKDNNTGAGSLGEATQQETINGCATNSAPTVNAGVTYSGAEGSPIALNNATATDPDNDALDLTWSSSSTKCTFSDTKVLNPSITCTDNGSYTATLKADDGQGHAPTSDATVNVSNVAPTATFSAQTPVDEGSSFTLELTNPHDASSDDQTAGFTYAFDCGDGNGYSSFSSTSSVSCSTDDNGTRSVGGKIKDKDGDASTYTGSVTVNNVAPTATGLTTNSPVNEGSDIVFSVAGVFDPSSVDASSLHYAFDCDDGNGWSASTYSGASSTNSKHCSTTDNGSRTVKGKVFDKDGGESGEQTANVTINNVAPTITSVVANPSGQLTLGSNNQVSTVVTVSFTDPAGTYDQPYATSINCDNGSAAVTGSPTTYGSSSATCTYTAATVGTRTISATVTDKDGGVSSASTTTVQVIYNWTGFFQPVDNTNLNVAKAGSGIPVKFNLGGNQGLAIFASGFPSSTVVTCGSISETPDAVEETVNAGNSSLTYDATANQYVYVWKSEKSWAGTCRRLDVKLIDGTKHTAFFQWTKF